jgi:hypothetical protein
LSDKKIEYLLRTEGTTFEINSNILKQDLPWMNQEQYKVDILKVIEILNLLK